MYQNRKLSHREIEKVYVQTKALMITQVEFKISFLNQVMLDKVEKEI